MAAAAAAPRRPDVHSSSARSKMTSRADGNNLGRDDYFPRKTEPSRQRRSSFLAGCDMQPAGQLLPSFVEEGQVINPARRSSTPEKCILLLVLVLSAITIVHLARGSPRSAAFADSAVASSIIDKPLVYQGCKIPIYLDNNATEIRVLDLPLGISNDDVVKVMSKYGEILTITNDRWINFFPGIPNGVRTLRMLLRQPTPKSITVNNAAATVTIIGKKSLCKLKAKNKKCADSTKKVNQKSNTPPIEPEPSSSSSKSNNSKADQHPKQTSQIDEEDNDGFEAVLSKHTRKTRKR
ncbi:conserved hypothetical protein [Culex quinquefasciatus]|uniref:Uncharacterized protein n=1 Tax=Culex quinquefasciatus TaxID=7176 RepID=B0WBS2_CULQU|nr:conserved hypothetical protein [Culex quinquefasciatus]|eukprot:XP_001846156.1 conserved hypothetical protein [Culex quinquefasciatus]